MSAEVENMFYVRETPWHGLGTMVQEALSSEEALKTAGLDWVVNQSPAAVKLPDGSYKDTEFIFNCRSSDNSVLGMVSKMYKVVQNVEAFAFTDSLLSTGEVKYETAGSLYNGKKVWIIFKASFAFLSISLTLNSKTLFKLVQFSIFSSFYIMLIIFLSFFNM